MESDGKQSADTILRLRTKHLIMERKSAKLERCALNLAIPLVTGVVFRRMICEGLGKTLCYPLNPKASDRSSEIKAGRDDFKKFGLESPEDVDVFATHVSTSRVPCSLIWYNSTFIPR